MSHDILVFVTIIIFGEQQSLLIKAQYFTTSGGSVETEGFLSD